MKVFVFGSNESGFHGGGAASVAFHHHGAKHGLGFGYSASLSGNSFAIPTKSWYIARALPISVIKFYVDRFLEFATMSPKLEFQVTQIGCGLAGFQKEEIAPLFENAPMNCSFDTAWKPFLGEHRKYWGTF